LASSASRSASITGLMPNWSPFSATRRTSGAVISRLMRCDLSSAMSEKLLSTLKKTAVLLRSWIRSS
jgi:hypothetical protein